MLNLIEIRFHYTTGRAAPIPYQENILHDVRVYGSVQSNRIPSQSRCVAEAQNGMSASLSHVQQQADNRNNQSPGSLTARRRMQLSTAWDLFTRPLCPRWCSRGWAKLYQICEGLKYSSLTARGIGYGGVACGLACGRANTISSLLSRRHMACQYLI
jgi:hypothetical protein